MGNNVLENIDYFKKQVKDLREKLNRCQSTGVLDDEFEEQLKILSNMEKEILYNLVPYYRTCNDNMKNTSMKLYSTNKLGSFNFDGFLKNIFKINKKLFITSNTDSKVQFLYLNTLNEIEIYEEWSFPIKKIKEPISYIHKLNNKEIILFGTRGGFYLITSDKFNDIENLDNNEIQIKKIKTNNSFNRFEEGLAINNNLFIVNMGNEKLNLLKLIKDKTEYRLFLDKETYCFIDGWRVFEKLTNNYFVVGTKAGEIYFVEFKNNIFIILKHIDFLSNEIRNIKQLESEDGSHNSLLVVGNTGEIGVVYLYKNKEIVREKLDILSGNLFDISSNKGTAVILSEDGIIYLLEENFGRWSLNNNATVKNKFFIKIVKFNKNQYILMDVDNKIFLLDIERVETGKDLFNIPLY